MTRDMEIVEREEQLTIKNKEVSFLAHYSRCVVCGNEFETSDQLDDSLDAAREAYARLYEAPSPEALVSLRAHYNASQKAFGVILGFGALTMNGYESGGTPDSTNRLLLKLSANPLIFKAMYEINSSKIGAIQRRRIEESDGFKAAASWTGLDALAGLLTPIQQGKIEVCAAKYSRTVPQQIATYVESASFQDYSRLYAEARWSEEETTSLPSISAPTTVTQGAA